MKEFSDCSNRKKHFKITVQRKNNHQLNQPLEACMWSTVDAHHNVSTTYTTTRWGWVACYNSTLHVLLIITHQHQISEFCCWPLLSARLTKPPSATFSMKPLLPPCIQQMYYCWTILVLSRAALILCFSSILIKATKSLRS